MWLKYMYTFRPDYGRCSHLRVSVHRSVTSRGFSDSFAKPGNWTASKRENTHNLAGICRLLTRIMKNLSYPRQLTPCRLQCIRVKSLNSKLSITGWCNMSLMTGVRILLNTRLAFCFSTFWNGTESLFCLKCILSKDREMDTYGIVWTALETRALSLLCNLESDLEAF